MRIDGGYAVAPNGASRFLVHPPARRGVPAGHARGTSRWPWAPARSAPAVAAGCTMVIKPAPQTPLSMLALAAILAEAGLPRRGAQRGHHHRRRAGDGAADPRRAGPQDVVHRLHRRWAASCWSRPPTRSCARRWSWAATRRSSCSPTPTSTPRSRARWSRRCATWARRAPRPTGSSCTAASPRSSPQAGRADGRAAGSAAAPRTGVQVGPAGRRGRAGRRSPTLVGDAVDRGASVRVGGDAVGRAGLLLPADRAHRRPADARLTTRRSSGRWPRSPSSTPRRRPSPRRTTPSSGWSATCSRENLYRALRVARPGDRHGRAQHRSGVQPGRAVRRGQAVRARPRGRQRSASTSTWRRSTSRSASPADPVSGPGVSRGDAGSGARGRRGRGRAGAAGAPGAACRGQRVDRRGCATRRTGPLSVGVACCVALASRCSSSRPPLAASACHRSPTDAATAAAGHVGPYLPGCRPARVRSRPPRPGRRTAPAPARATPPGRRSFSSRRRVSPRPARCHGTVLTSIALNPFWYGRPVLPRTRSAGPGPGATSPAALPRAPHPASRSTCRTGRRGLVGRCTQRVVVRLASSSQLPRRRGPSVRTRRSPSTAYGPVRQRNDLLPGGVSANAAGSSDVLRGDDHVGLVAAADEHEQREQHEHRRGPAATPACGSAAGERRAARPRPGSPGSAARRARCAEQLAAVALHRRERPSAPRPAGSAPGRGGAASTPTPRRWRAASQAGHSDAQQLDRDLPGVARPAGRATRPADASPPSPLPSEHADLASPEVAGADRRRSPRHSEHGDEHQAAAAEPAHDGQQRQLADDRERGELVLRRDARSGTAPRRSR